MQKSTYLTTLTPLRGIAALIVVIFHCNIMVNPFLPAGYTHLIDNGWLWVDFFFILSGFILSYVYGESFEKGFSGSAYKKYLKARVARVYPLHLFTLLWTLIGALVIRHLATGL